MIRVRSLHEGWNNEGMFVSGEDAEVFQVGRRRRELKLRFVSCWEVELRCVTP